MSQGSLPTLVANVVLDWLSEVSASSFVALTAIVLRPSFRLGERDLPVLLLIGVLDTAGNALFAVATTESLLSVAAVLGQLYPVVTVLLARIVLHERISAAQAAGVISAFAGVALLTLG